ncbi:hypothetical protein OH76DRAFT_757389 [Lentinus brumalis]|uniref:Uncharacterized protein n=1 Tax=Lentinus brumalis TaxID=2498619 RepID=A0A371DSW9_9APHY|nr:hypothetical protein OH76DRAFT_757389 [Polyporus brumalis]
MLYAATTNPPCHADIHAHMHSQECCRAKCGTGGSTALCPLGFECSIYALSRRYVQAALAGGAHGWHGDLPAFVHCGGERADRGLCGRRPTLRILAYVDHVTCCHLPESFPRPFWRAPPLSRPRALRAATRRHSVRNTCHGELSLDHAAPDDPSPI